MLVTTSRDCSQPRKLLTRSQPVGFPSGMVVQAALNQLIFDDSALLGRGQRASQRGWLLIENKFFNILYWWLWRNKTQRKTRK